MSQANQANQLALPWLAREPSEETWTDVDDEEVTQVTFSHLTVMRSEVVAALAPRDGGVYVDATLGGGGHTEAILATCAGARVIAFDRDLRAIAAASARLRDFGDRVRIVHANFGAIGEALAELGVEQVDGLCADLGVSSHQLDEASRGLSFRREGPIDMRMDQGRGETALDLIARLDDDALANVIFELGEEKRSRRIAHSIKKAHAAGRLETTLDLRKAIVDAVGSVKVGGIDPATRTFQALRIQVNDEMGELDRLLATSPSFVAPGGAVAILSFHSLEDRRVKRAFSQKDVWTATGKLLDPTEEERTANVRARSAKLRVAHRIDPVAEEQSAAARAERKALGRGKRASTNVGAEVPMSRYQRKQKERS